MGRLAKDTPTKICKKCGKPFNRRKFGNRLEDYTRYMSRDYCSKSCNYVRQPITSRKGYLYGARKHRRSYCENCGNTEDLQIHHKDENWKNNLESNLITLCPTCHMKWHWSQWKLRGHQNPLPVGTETNQLKPMEMQ